MDVEVDVEVCGCRGGLDGCRQSHMRRAFWDVNALGAMTLCVMVVVAGLLFTLDQWMASRDYDADDSWWFKKSMETCSAIKDTPGSRCRSVYNKTGSVDLQCQMKPQHKVSCLCLFRATFPLKTCITIRYSYRFHPPSSTKLHRFFVSINPHLSKLLLPRRQ